ncbi:MAG TPA: S1/P1 nuclease [Steroidobacteraceae bacterium]|nr:S1/P1 nuclease [Steroidobacteraceae bacterium]
MTHVTAKPASFARRVFLGLSLALLTAPAALAWNDFGHEVAAAAAWPRLTPAVRARVGRLLELNPDYELWTQGVPAAKREEVAFIEAAVWADDIKNDGMHVFDGDRPQGPDADRNLGYSDPLEHRYWHFIDQPFSSDHTRLVPPARPNIETELVALERSLHSGSASAGLKSYDLVWIEHLVGDAHQPLHAVSRFTRAQPQGDAGGNRVALCRPPCRRNLHSFWDDVLGKSRNPTAAIRYAERLPAPDPQLAAIASPRRWLTESERLAERYAYASPVGDGTGPYRLDAGYRREALEVARRQIALAGARLARVLNRDLAPGPHPLSMRYHPPQAP